MNSYNCDFEFQFNYVLSQIPRILSLQDRTPGSKFEGCFHYNYWRDKTQDFPDSRYQEAAATLGLVAAAFPQKAGKQKEQLINSFELGLRAWATQQHSDGSFDEWYKHEHGYASTAFTTFALGLPFYFNEEFRNKEIFNVYSDTADKSSNWLENRNDLFKCNHQAVGIGALAMAGKLLNKKSSLDTADLKLERLLNCQTEEGWFPEVGKMDLGYSTLLLDYIMMYEEITGNDAARKKMKILAKYFTSHIRPNLTINGKVGLCANPYLGKIGLLLLSKNDPQSASWIERFRNYSPGFASISPYLSDDLRLSRWGYLPLLGKIYLEKSITTSLTCEPFENKITISDKSGLKSVYHEDIFYQFSPASGGTIEIFDNKSKRAIFKDHGYLLELDHIKYSTAGYSTSRNYSLSPTEGQVRLVFSEIRGGNPSFILRFILRLGCSIPKMYKPIRALIDVYRKRKQTALNQSVSILVQDSGFLEIERNVKLTKRDVIITDDFVKYPKNAQDIFNNLSPLLGDEHGEMNIDQNIKRQFINNKNFQRVVKTISRNTVEQKPEIKIEFF